VAKNNRRRVGFRAGFVIAHANAVGLGKLQRRHFYHRRLTFLILSMTLSENRFPLFRIMLFDLEMILSETGL